MSELNVEITGFVAGDDLEVRRAVTDLPAAIESAWITVKSHPNQADDDATIQKKITTTNVPGTGQVVEAGGPGTDGDIRFDFTDEDTRTMGTRSYVFDIQIKLASGAIYTLERGTIQLTSDVTKTIT